MSSLHNHLWGKNAKVSYLFVAAAVLLLVFLGSREIWTQEHRWADIVFAMFSSGDFLHPSLDGGDYYDKPLLSYWLIAGVSLLTGKLSTFALRLPSALAGLLAIFSIYRLGTRLKDQTLGLIAGWLLLTTFYFVFWARTSSADMLNVAGTLLGVMWYFEKKDHPNFFNYSVFFSILALTALCKGLVGPVVVVLAIFPDLIMNQQWKNNLRWSFLLGMLPGVIIYILPFWASTHFGGKNYNENGLYLVYRENILRYFQPFDHKGPIYTYFIYLPIYLLPWVFFFFPALFALKSRWAEMRSQSKWMVWATLTIFLFFTLSGSRRSYYVLPLVPFAILMTADWIRDGLFKRRAQWAGVIAIVFYVFLFLNFDVMQPLYYSRGSLSEFAEILQNKVHAPLKQENILLLDVESKVPFYLGLAPSTKNLSVVGERAGQTRAMLLKAWPILKTKPRDMIFITRKMYVPLLKESFKGYVVIEGSRNSLKDFLKVSDENDPVAFIPTSVL